MNCYAISRPKRENGPRTVLVFPNRILRSTYLEYTEECKGEYVECTAKEAYKHTDGRKNVLHMSIMEHWDEKPFRMALERGMGDYFD